ncbi:hypothetical protein GKC32_07375 [Lactobacillus curvatus]|nr:hypothetical protein [Latilactobacillus curvatus]MSE24290.1 hypothetical protein [Latilactobacillus curvatus]
MLKRFGHTDSEMLQSFGLLNQHSVSAHATQITKQVQIIIKTEQAFYMATVGGTASLGIPTDAIAPRFTR